MEWNLTAAEARVMGSLIEKALTTPEYYPLTLNALVAACNQKSNRDPEMRLDEKEVVRALDALRDRKLAWQVSLAGSRAPKYRHEADQVLGVTQPQLAVLCELLLRGPQTVGELRSRAARMAPLTGMAEVEAVLAALAERPDGKLVQRAPRQSGQREERFMHCLCGAVPLDAPPSEAPPEPARLAVRAEEERLSQVEARLAAVEDELARLRAQVADFVRQFQ